MEGRELASEVPTSPTDYTADFTNATLWVKSEAAPDVVNPRGDNNWGAELSGTREQYANGLTTSFNYKLATSGAAATDEWSVPSGANVAAMNEWSAAGGANVQLLIERLVDGTGATPQPISPWSPIRCKAVHWVSGAADAQVEADADDYADHALENLVDHYREIKGLWNADPDYIFVAADVPGFNGYTYKSTINGTHTTLAAARDDFRKLGTSSLVDNGDSLHYRAASLIALGSGLESVRNTRTNPVATE